METPRPLLLAEAANPEWQSVPLVGWSHARAITERLPGAHLVTHIRNRAAILRAGLREGIDFTAIDSEAIAKPMWKLTSMLRGGNESGYTTIMALAPISYWYFEKLVWKHFGEDIRSGRYNVVHRITPMSPTVPSPLAKKCHSVERPFVLGPLNGGLPYPKQFEYMRGKEKEWMSHLRKLYKLVPGYRSSREHASALLCGARATFEELPARYQEKAFYMSENALDLSRFDLQRERRPQLPLKALFVGRLVPYKNADVTLEAAIEYVRRGMLELTIVGSGPERERLEQMAAENGVQGGVTFVDNVPHTELKKYYAEADLFLFPSIRELGGAVVIEAMLMGAVPVVVNYGGPPEFLTKETGFCLELGDRTSLVKQLRRFLARVVEDPSRLEAVSRAAMRHARENFTWQAKAERDEAIYRWILNGEAKPEAGFPDCEALVDATSSSLSQNAAPLLAHRA